MFRNIFVDEYNVLLLIVTITSVTTIISSLEWISLYRHFKEDGIFSWNVRKTSSKIFSHNRWYNYLFKYPNIIFLLLIQILILGIIPFTTENRSLLCILCFTVSSCLILFSIRNGSRFSGADQMNKVVFITLAICMTSASKIIWQSGLFFISCQVILAYCTPGFLRIFEPSWHNNVALTNILRLTTFGKPIVWKLLKPNPKLTKLLSICLIMFECCFLIAWAFPFEYLILFLSIGVVFHLANAVIMGLNNFLGSFVATYPAYIWCSIHLRELIF